MTTKLYDYYPYETEFDAVVLSCVKENTLYKVELDKTLFFPLEGGQTPDKGTINNIEVVDVKIKDNNIYHYMEQPVDEGILAHGVIDWNHRFKNMQMHSGEHIFTGLIHNKYGYDNVGFHLSDNSATMDYNGKLSDEEIKEIETLANQVIVSNIPIKAYYPEKKELDSLNYRSKKELSGDVRIVIIDGVDICACCAPHVRMTGEIGLLKVVSCESYKGGTRVNYLCGFRALDHYRQSIDSLKKVQNVLSVKAGNEASATEKLFNDYKKLEFDFVGLKNTVIENEILQTYLDKENEYAYWTGKQSDSEYIKFAVNTLHKVCAGVCAAFVGDEENGYRYIIENKNGDVLPIANELKEKYSAKGGGRSDSVQGNVKAKLEDLIKVIDKFSKE